jgi:hypothetical protein
LGARGAAGWIAWVNPSAADYEITSQIATHSPTDKNNIQIKDAAQLSRGGR